MAEKVTPIRAYTADIEKLAIEELAHIESITFTLSPPEALSVLACLQLALRHPGSTGAAADLARNVAKVIQGSLLAEPGSALAFMMEAGWNPDFDVQKTQ